VTYETILLTRRGQVCTLSLNRPDKLNALYDQVYWDMLDALPKLAKDHDVRALVLTGEGRAFCAGGDIHLDVGTLENRSATGVLDLSALSQKVSKVIYEFPKPVIARVNGVAVGGGFDLALACDIIIASDRARFGQFWVRRGMVPDMGGGWMLPKRIGMHLAKELVFTGDLIDAARAEKIGLCNRVVAHEDLDHATYELADRLAALPTQTIAMTKKLMNHGASESLDDYFQMANLAVFYLSQTDDHLEGIRAFKESREPRYTGR
jgi:2-(1,2-epoxy-1,2-dihydrophenyl)acetyl-CoA isomerase